MSIKKATEQRTIQEALELLPSTEANAKILFARIAKISPMKQGAVIVDIGAAQGRFVIACTRMGYKAIGIEPWNKAREIGQQLAGQIGVDIELLEGTGEKILSI